MFDATAGAFGHPAPNLDAAALARHNAGDVAFGAVFVPSTGLGPLFNNNACEACHVGDGRGQPPADGVSFLTMLFRASIPGTDPHGGPNPAGLYGGQLQLLAIPGFFPEAAARVTYSDSGGRFDDGTAYTLRIPHYSFKGFLGPLPTNLLTSPRVAPVNFGLGLLEATSGGDDSRARRSQRRGSRRHLGALQRRIRRDGAGLHHRTFRLEGQRRNAAAPSGRSVQRRHEHYDVVLPERELQGRVLPLQGSRGGARRPDGGRRRVLHGDVGRAGSAEPRRSASAARRAAVSRHRVRRLPRFDPHDRRPPRRAGRLEPEDSPVHGSVAARHGQRAGRQSARLRRVRPRVPHAAAVGHWARADGERSHVPHARWTRAQSAGSRALARRRSAKTLASASSRSRRATERR